MSEACGICHVTLKKNREIETGVCLKCEVDYHGCSTGDCPHESQAECNLALADLKTDQTEEDI